MTATTSVEHQIDRRGTLDAMDVLLA